MVPYLKTPTTTFAERVAASRKAKGWSQVRLAREVGCSIGIINQIELGKVSEVKQILLFKIADVLEVNARWLAIGVGTPIKWVNITPDERHLLDIFKALSAPMQDSLLHMAAAMPTEQTAPSPTDPFAGLKKPAVKAAEDRRAQHHNHRPTKK